MLNFSLMNVARGEERIQGEIPADDPIWGDARVILREPLQAELRAHSVGEGVLVRGHIRARVGMECRRCLTEVEQRIEEPVDLLFEPISDEEEEFALSGEVYPLPARGDQVDLRPALREQLLLKVPDHVVCKEACRGLCPRCGTELNRSQCSCVPEVEQSTWDALKKLKFD
jgi:uncharacterized protein